MKKNNLMKSFIIHYVTRSLTGRREDMVKLLKLASDKFKPDPGTSWFLKSLKRDLDQDGFFYKLFLRVGKELSTPYKRKIVRNLIINQNVEGAVIRNSYKNRDTWVPNFIVVSPTMRCNYRCTGCYSGLYTKKDELTETELDNLLKQCRDLGIYFIVISGGEPWVLKETLLRLFKKYNDMFFLTYTNGSFLDASTAKKLAALGNVAPALSLEGWERETDERRGPGAWAKLITAMENLKREGVFFGISVTYTKHNNAVVTDEKFIEYFVEKGAIFGWYFMFMPVGKDPILDLVPTPAQRVATGNKITELRNKYPIFLADFWNDGPAAGGCLAGGRQYLHVLNTGQVEPCVFAHFNSDNIREKSLIECVNSPFFKDIRAAFPYNDSANLKTPCMIIDNPQVLRDLVAKHVIPAGHEHSEDIINSREVRDFIDRYSEEMHRLTEPKWQEIINNPQERWYKEGKQYKNLFKYRKKPETKKEQKAKEEVFTHAEG